MNFEGHFDHIKQLLKPHQNIWYEEVLNFYPKALDHYPQKWVEQLQGLSKEQVWRLDGKKDPSGLPSGELKDLILTIQELIKLPQIKERKTEFPRWAMIKVKGKKFHEIGSIFPKFQNLQKVHQFSHAVDIGGGVGHLARTISHYGGLPCYSIDQDSHFQEIGKKRASKYPLPETAHPLSFIKMTFGGRNQNPEKVKELKELFSPKAFSIGLHTCGPLAVKHMQTNIEHQTSGLLNFGCCYAKMDPEQDINLSQYAQKDPLSMTTHTLTLATRGHSDIEYQDFLLKERVKAWRYTLHLLLYYKLDHKVFVTAGEAPIKLYWGNFSDYAKNRLDYLGIDCPLSENELNSFAAEKEVSEKVRWMFLANIIRWQFGRVIEHYILTDRCLYLQENGHEVEMLEYFDESISPRNIGILALKAKERGPKSEEA